MTFQFSGLPSRVQSLGSLSARNAALILATVAASWFAGTCLIRLPAAGAGSRPARLR